VSTVVRLRQGVGKVNTAIAIDERGWWTLANLWKGRLNKFVL
jgi:hypothetical protein